MAGEAEDAAPAGGVELPGRGEQAEPQTAGLPEAGLAGQGERGHPGQQVESDLDDLEPDLVLRGVVQGQVAQSGRAGGPGSVFGPGPQAVTGSSWAIGRSAVLVAKQVTCMSSASVILNWAPG